MIYQTLARMAATENERDREQLVNVFKEVRTPPLRPIYAGGGVTPSDEVQPQGHPSNKLAPIK